MKITHLLLSLLALAAVCSLPAQIPDSISITTDGAVNAVVRDGNYLYIGGNFSTGGYSTGSAALVTSASDVPDINFPKLSGSVQASVPDGAGGWYLGGSFSVAVGSQTYSYLVHVKADKTIDPLLSPNPTGPVNALYLDGNTLYAGGSFTSIGGQNLAYLARMNTQTGAVDAAWNPAPNAAVNALEISGDQLYVGGAFATIGGHSQQRFAKLDKATGTVAQTVSLNSTVLSLAQTPGGVLAGGAFSYGGFYTGGAALVSTTSDVPDYDFPILPGSISTVIPDGAGGWYAGGSFTVTVGAETFSYLVHIKPDKTIDPAFLPAPNALINTLLLDGGSLYVGGNFTSIGGLSRSYLAKLNATTGAADAAWNPNPNGAVNALEISGDQLYVGGTFATIGGHSQQRFAKLDKATGTVAQTVSLNSTVLSLAQTTGGVLAGGHFSYGGFYTGGAALVSTTSDVPDYDFPILPGSISTVIPDGAGGWYAGGSFTVTVGAQSLSYFVHIKSDKTIDPAFLPAPNALINTLLLDGGSLYVGGNFTSIGGLSRSYLAKLNAATGAADAAWNPNPNGAVNALEMSGDQLYVGGTFATIGGHSQQRFAKLDKATGTVAQTVSLNSTVLSLAQTTGGVLAGGHFSYGGFYTGGAALVSTTSDVPDYDFPILPGSISTVIPDGAGGWYAGGSFTVTVGAQSLSYFVHIKSDKTIDPAFLPDPNALINTLLLDGGSLYVGGNFTSIGGLSRSYLAKLNAATGAADAAWNPNPNGAVNALEMSGDQLYVGGTFATIGGHSQQRFAKLDKATGTVAQTVSLNSTVLSLAQTTGGVLAGGAFSYGGFYTGGAALVSTTSDVPDYDFPVLPGSITTVIPDGAGGWYAGGSFIVTVGAQSLSYLVHIKSDKTIDPAFLPDPNHWINTLLLDGGSLYAGGYFTSIGGLSRNYLAKLNATTGAADAAWNPNPNGAVNALKSGAGKLFVGGSFTLIGGAARNYLASFDIATGSLETWDPNPNGSILALDVFLPTIYLGGNFTTVGGLPRNYLAAVDLSGLVAPFNPAPNAPVYCFAVNLTNATVYVGGAFTFIGGLPRNYLAEVAMSTSIPTAWTPNPNASVQALQISGVSVYAGGSFTTIGAVSRRYAAQILTASGLSTSWNPQASGTVNSIAVSGSSTLLGGVFSYLKYEDKPHLLKVRKSDAQIEPGFSPNVNVNGSVNALATDGGTVYAGGLFTTIGGQSRNRLAALDTLSGNANGWNPNANSEVYALRMDGSTMYAGGAFTTIGGQPRRYVAALDKTTGALGSWNPQPNSVVNTIAVSGVKIVPGGNFIYLKYEDKPHLLKVRKSDAQIEPGFSPNVNVNGSVNALATDGGTVYAGGLFTTIGGQSRNRLAALDTLSGNANGWNPNANSEVYALRMDGSTMYAGGAFTTIGGQPRRYVAALDKTTGALGSWNPQPNSVVNTIAVSGVKIVPGGNFIYLKYEDKPHLLKVRKSDAQIEPGFSPNVNVNGSVNALATDGGTVYAGGLFTTIGGQSRNRLAALDTLSGNANGWNPNANSEVYALRMDGSTMYAGGAFTTIGGQPRRYVAALDKTTGALGSWNPQPNSVVNTIAVSGVKIVPGGNFIYLKYEDKPHLLKVRKSDAQIEPGFSPNVNVNGSVNALATDGGTVYAGGLFTTIGGQSRNRLAALDTLSGNANGWNPNANSEVYALRMDGSTMYAGGAFTTIGGQPRRYVAALDKTTGALSSWNPQPNGGVNTITHSGQNILLGGNFAWLKYKPATNLYQYDIVNQTITDWAPSPNGLVNAILVSGDTVFAGGAFSSIGGQTRKGLAALSKTTGNALPGWSADLNPGESVSVLEKDGNNLYFGGSFSQAGGQARLNAAAVNASTGALLAWNPAAGSQVYDLDVEQNDVYLAGAFTQVGGQSRTYLAGVNKTTGSLSSWNPAANGVVYTVEATATKVYAGGSFSAIGGQSRNNIAALSRSTGLATAWNPNANGAVKSVKVRGKVVLAGGDFTQTGSVVSNYFAYLDDSTGIHRTWFPAFNAALSQLSLGGSTLYAMGNFTKANGQNRSRMAALTLPVNIKAATGCGTSGTQLCIDISVENFTDVESFQYSMHFDPAAVSFSSVQSVALPANFTANTAAAGSGTLSFQWTDNGGQGVSLADGTVIYKLCFNLTGSPGTYSHLTFDGTPLAIQFTDTIGVALPYVFKNGLINVTAANFNIWTGAGDGLLWSDSLNWCNGVPEPLDNVFINFGTCNLNVPPTMSSLTINGGELKKIGAVTYSTAAPVTIGPNGMLNVFEGTLDLNGTFNNNGTVEGFGNIDLSGATVLGYGTFAPGNSAGTLTTTGTYCNEAAAIEVGGSNTGVVKDLLEVTQTIDLGGELKIEYLGGTVPPGIRTIMECPTPGCLTGTFAAMSFPPECQGGCNVIYTPNQVQLENLFTLEFTGTCTWLGGNGNWSNQSNWSCNDVPNGNDTVIINSGQVTLTGPAFAQAITVTNGTLAGSSPLTVTGFLAKNGSGIFNVNVPLQMPGGNLIANAGQLVFTGNFTYGGTISGNGALNFSNATVQSLPGGNFSPGSSPGALTVQGNYVNRVLNMEIMEIGGKLSKDLLVVGGNVNLNNSTLNLAAAGTMPAGTHELARFGSNTGSSQFATVNFPSNCTGCSLAYTPTGISVTNSQPCVPNLTLFNQTLATGTYRSFGNLVSSASSVANGGTVLFKSDVGVLLQQDFTVPLGAVFEVKTEGCQ